VHCIADFRPWPITLIPKRIGTTAIEGDPDGLAEHSRHEA
jgi:hypothetical protein